MDKLRILNIFAQNIYNMTLINNKKLYIYVNINYQHICDNIHKPER